MDSSSLPPQPAPTTTAGSNDTLVPVQDYTLLVDPFLVEALQNPRHRLTILRMDLDIQKFLQNANLQQFEFQHFPTSYLRLAAHRVAQHYGLQTMVKDNILDGQGTRILVSKVGESGYPAVSLSDVPTKHSEHGKQEHVKIVLKPRPNKTSSNETSERGIKRSPVRTVEERKEQYDRARARIFNNPGSTHQLEDILAGVSLDEKNLCVNGDENVRKSIIDTEKTVGRDVMTSSRVAILRDKEKDRTDPDYDRSYDRYVRNVPTGQGFAMSPFNMQKYQIPYVQYDSVFPQLGRVPATQASLCHQSPVMSPICAMGLTQASRDALYMQWPSHSMMYAQSYDQFRHAAFQASFQQPLSFDYSQNHH